MLEARKENKVYQINDAQKERYLKEGFDIYNGDKVVAHTPLKKIAYGEHLAIVAEKDEEIKKLKAEIKALKKTEEK